MSYIQLYKKDKILFCETKNISDIFHTNSIPLKLKIYPYIGDKILYECDLYDNMWATFNNYRNIKAKIFTNNGLLIKEYKYTYENDDHHPDYNLDEFWDYFSKTNKDSIGLILGAGDGTWGEWVRGVNENQVKCHLVEASTKTFDRLYKNYKNFFYTKLYNLIISDDGLDVTFYETDDDGFNTTNISFLEQNNIKYRNNEIRNTTEINNFLKEINQVDWIRIDIEGSDFQIIKSIDIDYLKNLKMLQYEHLHLDIKNQEYLDSLFISLGFKKIIFKIDTVYLKL